MQHGPMEGGAIRSLPSPFPSVALPSSATSTPRAARSCPNSSSCPGGQLTTSHGAASHSRWPDPCRNGRLRRSWGSPEVTTDVSNAFRSHYGFDAFNCLSGHEGSHEKGGVEGEGGRFRRNHCVPMAVVDSIDELNALLEEWDDADDRRRVGNRT